MRRRPIIVLLLLAMAGCTPKVCMTEREVVAGTAMGFLLAQRISSKQCDAAGSDAGMGMTALHEQIADKFAGQFGGHSEVRAGYYRRVYDDQWQKAMKLNRAEVERRIRENLVPSLNPAVCGNLRTEMEIRRDSDWSYIKAKLDYATRQATQSVKVCK